MEVLNFSRLSENCKVNGTLDVVGDYYIAGKVMGNIQLTGNGLILIEPTGEVEGEIHCEDLQIMGIVKGNIHSNGHVVIKASGQVFGTIQSKSLKIMPGARLELDVFIEENH